MKADFSADMSQLRSELNGDGEHDRDVLMAWAERYRGNPEAKPFLKEIGRLLFSLNAEENTRLTEQAIDEVRREQEQALSEAKKLRGQGNVEQAAQRLASAVKTAVSFPLSGEQVWMDFDNYLEGMLFQEYFETEIGGRQILPHPLHPAKLLFFYGSLLIELGRTEEAVRTLERLRKLNPVRPQYLFELGDAYKRVGRIQDAYNTAEQALLCATDGEAVARAYRDAAYCLAERGDYENASALYQLSLRFEASLHAQAELAWIGQQTGRPPVKYPEAELLRRCKQLQLPVGVSETVKENMSLLKAFFASGEE